MGRFGKDPAPPPHVIRYRLPVTEVTMAGTVTTTRSSLTSGPPEVERAGTIDLSVVAEGGAERELVLSRAGTAQRTHAVTARSDGRLTTVGATVDDRRDEVLGAIVKVGAAAAGVAVAVGVPVLGAVAVGAVVAGAGAATISGSDAMPTLKVLGPPPASPAPAADLAQAVEALGIHEEYARERPGDAELLGGYRVALRTLSIRHVETAVADRDVGATTRDVRSLGSALRSVREEAAAHEARYEAWVRSKQTIATRQVHQVLAIDEVPTRARLEAELAAHAPGTRPRWWRAAHDLATMISLDLLDGSPTDTLVSADEVPAGSVVVRTPRPALLRTWKLVDEPDTTRPQLELERADRITVVLPGTEMVVALAGSKEQSTAELSIDADGAVVAVDLSTTSARAARAERLAALPEAVSTGLAAGTAVGTALSPQVREAERLEREVEMAENRAKLKAPDTPDTETKALQEELARLELEGEVELARHLRDHPGSVTVVVRRDA